MSYRTTHVIEYKVKASQRWFRFSSGSRSEMKVLFDLSRKLHPKFDWRMTEVTKVVVPGVGK